MKYLFVLVFIFNFSYSGFTQDNKTIHRLVIDKASTIRILGKTNVNEYQCEIEQYIGNDTLFLTAERGKGAYFKKGVVRLNAALFDCGMKPITNDFSKTIEADKYPSIDINFISFERVPKYEATEEKFSGNMTIMLAGKSVSSEVRCSIIKDDKGLIHLRGKRNFKFSDFGLKPPSRMGGLIKVAEKITVDFHLVLMKLG